MALFYPIPEQWSTTFDNEFYVDANLGVDSIAGSQGESAGAGAWATLKYACETGVPTKRGSSCRLNASDSATHTITDPIDLSLMGNSSAVNSATVIQGFTSIPNDLGRARIHWTPTTPNTDEAWYDSVNGGGGLSWVDLDFTDDGATTNLSTSYFSVYRYYSWYRCSMNFTGTYRAINTNQACTISECYIKGTRTGSNGLVDPVQHIVRSVIYDPSGYRLVGGSAPHIMDCLLIQGVSAGSSPVEAGTHCNNAFICLDPAPVIVDRPNVISGNTVLYALNNYAEGYETWQPQTAGSANEVFCFGNRGYDTPTFWSGVGPPTSTWDRGGHVYGPDEYVVLSESLFPNAASLDFTPADLQESFIQSTIGVPGAAASGDVVPREVAWNFASPNTPLGGGGTSPLNTIPSTKFTRL